MKVAGWPDQRTGKATLCAPASPRDCCASTCCRWSFARLFLLKVVQTVPGRRDPAFGTWGSATVWHARDALFRRRRNTTLVTITKKPTIGPVPSATAAHAAADHAERIRSGGVDRRWIA